ncbi:hypothetical protein DWB61_09705 [Ancylomarina euxinus]|uniref:DUF5675 domain-containing protein n=1 Tax=Ancylomarina euxinus TaxID=2283627 RepID=A0A425Y0Y6_9BACT|nr:DUF5675 family protein [Ancylomarina euxinus]MCZ4693798.1 DUF5675 family protein [Ancylomarina euxinus]MUP15123.1 hypothetical protein [Ancylomarina euxinus]RRG21546.1 hypothetical protein DWB61_09705 [Ancylomarina euxinus]
MKAHDILHLRIIREEFTSQTTVGKMYIDGHFFGYTLEDTVRAFGIKVKGHTALPAYQYQVKLSFSPKYERMMPLIFNQSDESVNAMGIQFKGIRFHGGNRHSDTEGCILVAKHRVTNQIIQGSLEKELSLKIAEAENQKKQIALEIING